MTPHLDKISQKENKHIRALQCLDACRLGSHQIERSFLGEPEGVGSRVYRTKGLLCPMPEPISCFIWMVPALPVSSPALPTPRAAQTPKQAPLGVPQSEKSDTI